MSNNLPSNAYITSQQFNEAVEAYAKDASPQNDYRLSAAACLINIDRYTSFTIDSSVHKMLLGIATGELVVVSP